MFCYQLFHLRNIPTDTTSEIIILLKSTQGFLQVSKALFILLPHLRCGKLDSLTSWIARISVSAPTTAYGTAFVLT